MSNDVKEFPIKDINGKIIYNGNTVLYNEKTYIITYIDKDNIGWIMSPCNNNPELDCINLSNIPLTDGNSNFKLELVM